MSDLVPTEDIERIVGHERHKFVHLGRAVSADQRVYILHPHECLESAPDLRDCEFSLALDNGIDPSQWIEDVAVILKIRDGRLSPVRTSDLLADPYK